jgi:hypothetical protein
MATGKTVKAKKTRKTAKNVGKTRLAKSKHADLLGHL